MRYLFIRWLCLFIGTFIFQYGHAQTIQKLEYFIDNDPGYGAATDVSFNEGTTLSDLEFIIDVSAIVAGRHILFVRAQDADGNWSEAGRRAFYKYEIVQESLADTSNISKIEYFIDTDPGYGNGIEVSFNASSILDDLSFTVDIENLSEGLHFMYVRIQDINGNWSEVGRRTFYRYSIDNTQSPDALPITSIEYAIDTDPGLGQGTTIDIESAVSLENLVFDIDIANLDEGVHTVFIRTQDQAGNWSETSKRNFLRYSLPNETLDNAAEIVAMEYFINDDPGYGSATAIAITTALDIENFEFDVDLVGLEEGSENTIHVRAQDTNGRWSEVATQIFVVCADFPNVSLNQAGQLLFCPNENPEVSLSLEGVSEGETIQWYLDNNPISGATDSIYNATQFGNYFARIGNDSGCEISTETVSIAERDLGQLNLIPETIEPLCFGETNELSIEYSGTASEISYRWFKDGMELDSVGTSLLANSSGTYEVIALLDSCELQSEPLVITIEDDFEVEINDDFTTCLDADPINLSASPMGGIWQGAADENGMFTPNGIGSFQAIYTYTNIAGCSKSDTVLITVLNEFIVSAGADPGARYGESIQLAPEPSGGIWEGEDVTPNGVFTPQRLGDYSLVYSLDPEGCGGADTLNLSVQKGFQTISFATIPEKEFGDEDFDLEITYNENSGQALQFILSNENMISIDGLKVSIQSAGQTDIAVFQEGNEFYEPSDTVTQRLVVNGQTQVITFAPIADRVYGDDFFELDASSSADLSLTFESSDESIASVNGNTLEINGVGEVTITARQEGSGGVGAAEPVSQSFTIAKGSILIKPNDVSRTFGTANPEFTISYQSLAYGRSASEEFTQLPSVSTSANTNSNVGTYRLIASGAQSDKYTISYNEGWLTVTKAQAEIFLSNLEQEFDESPKQASITTNPSGLNFVATYDGSTNPPTEIGEYELLVTINEGNYEGEEQAVFIISGISSVADALMQEAIKLYPNPVIDALEIDFAEVDGLKDIKLVNMQGQVILQLQAIENKLQLNLNSLQSGLYILSIQDADGRLLKLEKVVKK